MSSASSQAVESPRFTLHLCSYAQDVNGLLTMVNAGLENLPQGEALHLAGFVDGIGSDLIKEPLIVTAGGGEESQELVHLPPPPDQAVPSQDDRLRVSLSLDLSGWSMTAVIGEYQIAIRFAGGSHSLPLHILGATPASAE